jgi:proteasome lid subunit RPN8/RPN11
MISIVFTPEIQKKIREIVYSREVETGVTLFGNKKGPIFSVTDACGPNPLATPELCHHYCGDEYASFIYADLLKRDPTLEHLGTLHTHPNRMCRLSNEDRENIKEALKTSEAFVAGVMLRLGGGIEAYPVYFSHKIPGGREMRVLYANPSRGAGRTTGLS